MRRMILLAFMLTVSQAQAEEAHLEKVRLDTSISAVERGAEQLMGQCHSCHSLKYVHYRDLIGFGMDKKKVNEWRGDQAIDAPMTSQMSDEAAMASFGKIPPDLSLMTKAREGGVNYVYSYLIGYYTTPEGMPGNHIFPETKMPDILGMSGATDQAQQTQIKATAHDIVNFLNWAADPHYEARKHLGYYVLGYLFVLTGLLYLVKQRVWARLK